MVLFSLGVIRLAVKHLCARFLQLHLRMKPFLGGPYIYIYVAPKFYSIQEIQSSCSPMMNGMACNVVNQYINPMP